MATKTAKPTGHYKKLAHMLLDTGKPTKVRAKTAFDVLMTTMHDPQAVQALLAELLEQAAASGGSKELEKLKEKYKQALEELESGPARPATFISQADGTMPGPKPRAHVCTPDGQERFPSLHPDVNIEGLQAGKTVYLDAKGAMLLGASEWIPNVGQEAEFVRRLDGSQYVEVRFQGEKLVPYASWKLLDAIEAEEITRGDQVLMCPRRQFAFMHVPRDEDRSHRFVDSSRIREVIAARDIGKPHWILGWMRNRLRIMLTRPDLMGKYDLRPRFSVLMTGPTGTGKTLTIRAFLHEFHQMLREFTGREDVGSRVIRVKTSDLLSEWFGVTDRNIDALFSDIYELASEEFETADGGRVRLPVTVIMEEGEGLGRRRGEYDGGVYDRVIGMLLQRLDDPTDDLNELPLCWITSSNRPDMLDAAMTRRLADVRAVFKRLDREGFAAVLGKKLKPHYPYASRNGTPAGELRRAAIDQVVSWFYSPNAEQGGVVELTMRDGKKLLKERRDFLTGAVVEQGVSRAIDRAVFRAASNGQADPGLAAAGLIEAICESVAGLVENLTPANAADYLDLPEHASVASVRRLRSSGGRLPQLAE